MLVFRSVCIFFKLFFIRFSWQQPSSVLVLFVISTKRWRGARQPEIESGAKEQLVTFIVNAWQAGE